MAKYDEFKTPLPRSQQAIVARCFGTPEMFLPEFTDMPKALQDAFGGGLGIPCEGGGIPGQWCSDCVFGEVVEVDSTELLDLL